MAAGSNAPIIIKRKKVIAGGGHHGGAWKVAYADFVTAMMAFFMLMWLLNATTEKQRKGIADYFNPTIPINRISGGGEGAFGGESIFSEVTLAQNGIGASSQHPTAQRQAQGANGNQQAETASGPEQTAEETAFQAMATQLSGKGGESMVSDMLARHITTRLTDEGLIIEIFDIEGSPLFHPRTSEPLPVMEEIAGMLTRVFSLVKNGVAVNGHVQAAPEVLKVNPSWDLSTERAHSVRALMENAGFESDRMRRVVGHSDRKPVAANPMAIRNNRVELVLLRSDINMETR